MAEATRLPPLVWLRTFEACARHLNFTSAGAELGLTQAAVSQHIRTLEAELGARLFVRLRRGVELTAEGGAYLPHIQGVFRSLARSTTELFGPRVGRVALRSPISFSLLWLAPRLSRLRQALPQVRLELSTVHVPADYAGDQEGFDIRFGIGPFEGRESHRLTWERLVPAAAPDLLHLLDDPANWPHLPLLSVAGAREMWPDWFARAALPLPPSASFVFDSFAVALEAARAGAGAVLASRPLADAALEEGTLVRLSDLELTGECGHFITHAAGRALAAHEQAMLDWILGEAAR
ncbi:LysR family transcriptional regulator [Labrys miyagiensis]|uniref:LysR family transcriptional regulator n=1 Tax=Labrys miyagiensis TaxID=346912 RepID=A0ABQ6CHC6_9HYPH|nr:LysR family transcriptional regulator [Labrys miyagiensis]GLS19027.1 LysR family transcriptional regulator [Labrys miyagiensis]